MHRAWVCLLGIWLTEFVFILEGRALATPSGWTTSNMLATGLQSVLGLIILQFAIFFVILPYSLHLLSSHSLAHLTVSGWRLCMACPHVCLAFPLCSWLAQLAFDVQELHLACLTSTWLVQSPLPCSICIVRVGLWLAGPAGILLARYAMCVLIYQDGTLSGYCAYSLGICLPSLHIA